MACFLVLLRINKQLLQNQASDKERNKNNKIQITGVYKSSKVKIKQKEQYLNLKSSQYYQKIGLLLKTTGLKLISRQERIIFTTGCFNDIFLANTTPTKRIFYAPIGSDKKIGYF